MKCVFPIRRVEAGFIYVKRSWNFTGNWRTEEGWRQRLPWHSKGASQAWVSGRGKAALKRCCKGKVISFGNYLEISYMQGNARKKYGDVTKMLVNAFETKPVSN